jgi:putative pyoverdin transport system ATP-binding/permease protein
MNVIKFILRNSSAALLFVAFAGIVGGICGAGLIMLIHITLRFEKGSGTTMLYAFAGVCILLLVTNIVSQVLLLRISQGAIFDLRMRLSRQILAAPLRQLEEAGSARLLTCLTNDATTISNVLINFPILCINLATLSAVLVYAGWLSRPLLFGLVIFMAFGILSYRLPFRMALQYQRLAREQAEGLMANFRAVIDGNKELKLNRTRRDEFYSRDLSTSAANARRYATKSSTIYIITDAWGRSLHFFFIGLLLFALPQLFQVSAGSLTGYVLLVLYMMGPLTVVLNVLPQLAQAKVSLQRIEELGLSLDSGNRENDSTQTRMATTLNQLELSGVTHTYRGEKDGNTFTLGPIDLSFSAGELVFITGGNGSGKSTLAKLLTGLYIPEDGEIWLNGERVTDETRVSYRQFFSAVFSDFHLFQRLPGSDANDFDTQAHGYLEQFQIDHLVKVEAGMLSTLALSHGQRKRLALLSVYLEDRPFYLFDEWASDQDPTFKAIFYTQMLPELKLRGKTVVVISHDDNYYGIADRIIKLDYGKCIQDQSLVSLQA